MRYLVTGGAGAIGSTLSLELLSRGHDVTILDDLSSGYQNLVPSDAELIIGSVTDEGALERAFHRKPDIVAHLAALFANQNSVDHPHRDLDVNGAGTLRVLEACVKSGVQKAMYVSSSCVYGDSMPMREDDIALRPHTPYAITKLLGEYYCSFFTEHHGLNVFTVRLFNTYGPHEYPGSYRNVIPNFFHRALRRQPLLITGSGEETRDFTFVRDVVAGVISAIEARTTAGAVFNLGSGRETRIRDLAEQINELTGNTAGIEFAPRRGWDRVDRRYADITLAREAFGYEPNTTLAEGLAETHAWLASVVG